MYFIIFILILFPFSRNPWWAKPGWIKFLPHFVILGSIIENYWRRDKTTCPSSDLPEAYQPLASRKFDQANSQFVQRLLRHTCQIPEAGIQARDDWLTSVSQQPEWEEAPGESQIDRHQTTEQFHQQASDDRHVESWNDDNVTRAAVTKGLRRYQRRI